jgi:hypothetical protein
MVKYPVSRIFKGLIAFRGACARGTLMALGRGGGDLKFRFDLMQRHINVMKYFIVSVRFTDNLRETETLWLYYRTAETTSVVYWSEFLATDPEVRVCFPSLPDFLRLSGRGTASVV